MQLVRHRYVEAVGTTLLVAAIAYYLGHALVDYNVRTFGLGHGSTFAMTAMAAIVLALVRAATFPGFLALATLAVLNGIPFVDIESFASPGSFRVSDLAVIALIVVLAARQDETAASSRFATLARAWAVCLGLWWLLTWTRSVVDGIPVLKAGLFGRDFLYFAILVPLAIGAFGKRRDIYTFLIVLAVGGVIYQLAQIAISGLNLGGGFTGLFVHETISNDVGGVKRVYAYMDYVAPLAAPICLGIALSPVRRGYRIAASLVAAIATVSLLLAFTRAVYIGLMFALLAVTLFWIRRQSPAAVGLRRITLAMAAVVLALIVTGGLHSLVNSSASTKAVATRATTALQDIQNRTGTVQYRYDVQRRMIKVLGPNWLQGLGFLHPDAHPVPSLPQFSIRNSDVGVMNSVMTMGLIGTALLYAAPLFLLFTILARRNQEEGVPHEWFFFGMAVWLLDLVISSISLVTLFSVQGLVFAAMLIGCATGLLADTQTPAPEPLRPA